MSKDVDSWDDEPIRTRNAPASASGAASKNTSKKSKTEVIRDDWEAEDDEDDPDPRSVEIQNKKIWESANLKEAQPMPAVVMSSSVGATMPTLPLNQPPTVRILKRPSGSPSPSSVNTNTPTGQSFQDREARYQAARERIFGTSMSNEESHLTDGDKKSGEVQPAKRPSASASSSSSSVPTQRIIREPRGPDTSGNQQNGSASQGFGARQSHKPSGSLSTSGGGS